jgi:hypothetical protein
MIFSNTHLRLCACWLAVAVLVGGCENPDRSPAPAARANEAASSAPSASHQSSVPLHSESMPPPLISSAPRPTSGAERTQSVITDLTVTTQALPRLSGAASLSLFGHEEVGGSIFANDCVAANSSCAALAELGPASLRGPCFSPESDPNTYRAKASTECFITNGPVGRGYSAWHTSESCSVIEIDLQALELHRTSGLVVVQQRVTNVFR